MSDLLGSLVSDDLEDVKVPVLAGLIVRAQDMGSHLTVGSSHLNVSSRVSLCKSESCKKWLL